MVHSGGIAYDTEGNPSEALGAFAKDQGGRLESIKSPIFACQRLKNGNTFIGECNAGRLLEVSPDGNIVSDICILPEGVSDGIIIRGLPMK